MRAARVGEQSDVEWKVRVAQPVLGHAIQRRRRNAAAERGRRAVARVVRHDQQHVELDQWPNGLGFEYFYGFMGGDASQWQPNLFRNTTAIFPFQDNPGWNLTTAMADEAIYYMKQNKEIAPDKPFFVYYVPGGTHSPHHPTPEWIETVSDMHLFDQGWNKLRETIFENQKRLGIMPRTRS